MAEIFDVGSARHCAEITVMVPAGSRDVFIAACDEIERLQKAISEPLEVFGTPELIAWSQELTRLLDVPESERGLIPFVLMVGCHLEKFAKSWNSQTMAEQAKKIEDLRILSDDLMAHCNGLRSRATKAEAEIERLRGDLNKCAGYVGIGPNEGQLPIPERVRLCVNRMNGSVGRYEQEIIKQYIKIDEQAKDIERLRAENAKLNEQADLNCDAHDSLLARNSEQVKRIKELEAQVSRMDRALKENYDNSLKIDQFIQAKDATIDRARDALVEERAKVLAWERIERDAPHYSSMRQAAREQLATERPDLGPWEDA